MASAPQTMMNPTTSKAHAANMLLDAGSSLEVDERPTFDEDDEVRINMHLTRITIFSRAIIIKSIWRIKNEQSSAPQKPQNILQHTYRSSMVFTLIIIDVSWSYGVRITIPF